MLFNREAMWAEQAARADRIEDNMAAWSKEGPKLVRTLRG